MQFVAFTSTVEPEFAKMPPSNHEDRKMSMSQELDRLGDLHRKGVLTDDEFGRAKTRVLQGLGSPAEPGNIGALNGLRRTREDRWIGGVCGGIARMTDMAPWIWRLIFVLTALCGGTGVLFYLLLWILLPIDPPFVAGASWPVRQE